VFLPTFDELKDILRMVTLMLEHITVNDHILEDSRYDLMFSVEEVNRLAAEGMPFRDAYKKVGLDIEAGRFTPVKEVRHTHEGSVGNLCNDRIQALMDEVMSGFNFRKVDEAVRKLVQ
jgi:argininosuccinate lyase